MEERIYIEGNGNNYIRDKEILVNVPEQCPLCESIMSPIIFPNAVISDTPIEKTWPGNFSVFQVTFITRCTKCKRLYTNVFEIYKDNYNNLNISKSVYHQTKMPNIDINFSENIQALSPMFIKTYTQAIQAEKLNLNELSGMGFRKALEFNCAGFCARDFINRVGDVVFGDERFIRRVKQNHSVSPSSTVSSFSLSLSSRLSKYCLRKGLARISRSRIRLR